MKSQKNKLRRNFIKKSVIAATGLAIVPGFFFEKNLSMVNVKEATQMGSGQNGVKTVAFITNEYRNSSHADVIGTKLFIGIPMDEGLVTPQVKIVSMWIDQIGPYDTGVRIAEMNGATVYPTIAEALTLGGDKLAVDAVIFIGEHGDYKNSRLGVKMYPE